MPNMEQIQEMFADIYDITGIKAVLYDADMRFVYAHPRSMGSFCRCIRRDPHMDSLCRGCDREGFARCRQTGELVIYRCHMGLTEAVAPVIDNDTVIGYILFGQMLSEGSREQIEDKVHQGNFPQKDTLLKALAEMQTTEDRIVKASARLIAMCASNIRLKNILRLRREGLSVRITDYLATHLPESELSIGTLCHEFGISRGTLYAVSKEAFGIGITEYIRHLRLNRAIALIRQGDLPMWRVAEAAGFTDPNYMARCVRQKTGMTPKKLQQKYAEKRI